MGAVFKKSTNMTGKFRMLNVSDGEFINSDGEIIPVAKYIEDAFGSTPFDLSVSAKDDEEIISVEE